MSFERTVRAKTLDARRSLPCVGGGGHDSQEVIPAPAGIQEPYRQLQTALKAPSVWRGGPAPVFWHTGDEYWQKLDGVRYARSVTTVVHIDPVIHALDIAWQKFLVVYPSLAENIPAPPSAKVFSAIGKQTECFVRCSTVAGERGAADAERDVRGFAWP